MMRSKALLATCTGLALLGSHLMQAPAMAQAAPAPASPPLLQTAVPAPMTEAQRKAAQAEENKRLGSLYLRCDGQPNNITGLESFGRLLGAVTLLGIFAPAPESPDRTKRLFGAKGVEACSALLDDPKQETNQLRRLPLILARALHQIEAKNYEAARLDVQKARAEAATIGLTSNPYFNNSLGLSFNLIDAHALFRMGKAGEARQIGLLDQAARPYSYYAAITANNFSMSNRDMTPQEEQFYRTSMKLVAGNGSAYSHRLHEVGRHADAAAVWDSIIVRSDMLLTETRSSYALAKGAISHAAAGNWTRAADLAAAARSNQQQLIDAGKPENNQSALVELLDFYEIMKLEHEGKLAEARRNFAARSRWIEPQTGVQIALGERLRQGASADQVFGALAATREDVLGEREKRFLAERLERDGDNRTLFSYILPYATIDDYERQSKDVWRTDKSRMISKEPIKDSKFYSIISWGGTLTQPESMLLHAALQAKSRGYPGFVYFQQPLQPNRSLVQFARPDDADVAQAFYLDADAVIAELRQLIPSPVELAERKKQKRK